MSRESGTTWKKRKGAFIYHWWTKYMKSCKVKWRIPNSHRVWANYLEYQIGRGAGRLQYVGKRQSGWSPSKVGSMVVGLVQHCARVGGSKTSYGTICPLLQTQSLPEFEWMEELVVAEKVAPSLVLAVHEPKESYKICRHYLHWFIVRPLQHWDRE